MNQSQEQPFWFVNTVGQTKYIHRMPFLFDCFTTARAYMLGAANTMQWKPKHIKDVISEEMVGWVGSKVVNQQNMLALYKNKEEGFTYTSTNDWPPKTPNDVEVNGELNNSTTRMIDV